MVFISRQNLGWSGNCEIPDRLGFSRHMKTRLKDGYINRQDSSLNRFKLIKRKAGITCHTSARCSKIDLMVVKYTLRISLPGTPVFLNIRNENRRFQE